ncbi:MAG TPA: SMP-30/gluconolactonase/LRE family protein [Thermoleophilaceae bacterium]
MTGRARAVLRRARFAIPLAAAVALTAAAPAAAVPDCPSVQPAKDLLTGQGRLESIVGDARGRLFYTDLSDNRLLRLDGPGQQPRVLAEDMARPGGLVFEPSGALVAGFAGGATSGVPGSGGAGMFRVNPETGAKQVFVKGLDQANGVVRAADGSLYTSNDISNEIVRVRPDGSVQRHWVDVDSANGLAIDTRGHHLFVAQTFTPAKIARVELADPTKVTTYFTAPPEDTPAGLDGMTRDAADRLYVAANGGGEVWRVGTDAKACALARGLGLPSAAAFGGGGGFDPRNLYVVTFSGRVIEIPRATDRPEPPPPGVAPPAGLPRLELSVRPRTVRARRLSRLRVRVTSAGRAVAGVSVRLGRRRARSDARGRARLAHRFAGPRRAKVRALRAGYRPAVARVRVLEAR